MRLAVVLLWVAAACAQDALTVNRPVESDELAPGGFTFPYTIHLNAGDYVAGSVDQRGAAVGVQLFLPGGSRLRDFPGPPEGKREFAFVADGAGTYRLELKSLAKTQVGKYELRLTEILTLDERMKPAPPKDKYANSKIEALRGRLASGQTDTEAFWREVAKKGNPAGRRRRQG